MSTLRHRIVLLVCALAVALAACGGTALASQSTITQQDCAQGRIHDQSGQPISMARCQRLIGRSVRLASTGFDARIPAAAGIVCLLAGAALLRPTLRRTRT